MVFSLVSRFMLDLPGHPLQQNVRSLYRSFPCFSLVGCYSKKCAAKIRFLCYFFFCLGIFGLAELRNTELKIVIFSAVGMSQVANAGYTCEIVSLQE